MTRSVGVTLAAILLGGSAVVAPSAAGDTSSHAESERWHPYHQEPLLLPAERYCGEFDLRLTPVFQDVRYRVLSRWDSGGPRETVYDGPLLTDATNAETGATVRLNLSGRALTVQREDGSLKTYETDGPVGMGFPVGSIGLDPGFYVFKGRHLVGWDESGQRSLLVDQGVESDACEMVD